MGHERDRIPERALLDRDDIEDPSRYAELRPLGVGFLNPHVEAVTLELFHQIGTRSRIGLGADRPTTNSAGEHVDMSLGVGLRKTVR